MCETVSKNGKGLSECIGPSVSNVGRHSDLSGIMLRRLIGEF